MHHAIFDTWWVLTSCISIHGVSPSRLRWGLIPKQDPGMKVAKCLWQFLADSRCWFLEYEGISSAILLMLIPTTLESQIGFSWKLWTKMTPTYWGSVGFVLGRRQRCSSPGLQIEQLHFRECPQCLQPLELEYTRWAVPRGRGSRQGPSGQCKEIPGFTFSFSFFSWMYGFTFHFLDL